MSFFFGSWFLSRSDSMLSFASFVTASFKEGPVAFLGAFEKNVSSLACVTRFEAGSEISRNGRQSTNFFGFESDWRARCFDESSFELTFTSPPLLSEMSGSVALHERSEGFPEAQTLGQDFNLSGLSLALLQGLSYARLFESSERRRALSRSPCKLFTATDDSSFEAGNLFAPASSSTSLSLSSEWLLLLESLVRSS